MIKITKKSTLDVNNDLILQILTNMTGLGLDFEDDFFFEEDKMLVM